MRRNSFAAGLLLALACAGCSSNAPPAAPAVNALPSNSGTFIGVTSDGPGKSARFYLDGTIYDTSNALLQALDAKIADELSKVVAEIPAADSLRVVLPATYKGDFVKSEALRRLDQGRIDALQKAGLFRSIRTDYADLSNAVTKGRDYVLYKIGTEWRLKDSHDRETQVLAALDLSGFVSHVATGVTDLKGDLDFLQVLASRKGFSGVFFRGREYKDSASLGVAFDEYNTELLRRVKPGERLFAGRALVIIPTEPGKSAFNSGYEHFVLMDEGRREYRLSVDKRIARFISASQMFKAVEVDFGNETNPPQGGFDWVIWREPDNPLWSVREKGGDTLLVRIPSSPENFSQELKQVLRPMAEETPPAPQVQNTPAPPMPAQAPDAAMPASEISAPAMPVPLTPVPAAH